jgi:hypothetical protein
MKFFTLLTITLALATPLAAQTPATSSQTDAQVKQELEQAARMYREGKFAEAQVHSERALLLDPENKTAPQFLARTIHAQYRPGDFTPENTARAREAIIAYQRILDRSPYDDEPYKAIAYLYGAIKDEAMLRHWLLQRAENVSFANDKRAEAFVVLASKDWACSYEITETPAVKDTTVRGNKAYINYKMPKERVEFERAQECANRGLEMANMAITLTPENESAWSYKTNLLLELAKLAEMSENATGKRELDRQYNEALKRTNELGQPKP